MRRVITTIGFDPDLYEQLKLYVFSRRMLEPGESMAKVVDRALREYFAKEKAK